MVKTSTKMKLINITKFLFGNNYTSGQLAVIKMYCNRYKNDARNPNFGDS